MIELQDPDWWNQVPTLTGSTLKLREVEHRDLDTLFELLTDPRVTEHISSPPPSAAAFQGFIDWAHHQRESGKCICFAVVPNGLQHAIGLFQVRALEPTFRTAEWGFAIGASFWSTGIFEEAAVLVAQFAFTTIGVHRLEARAVVDNTRGNRALEKIGAQGEAVLRKAFNRSTTQFLWSIIAEDWTPPQKTVKAPFDAAKLKREIGRVLQTHTAHGADRVRDARPFPFFLTDSSRKPDGEP
jgi:RimJ/RimL family protein N-acetyltransferase